MIKFWNKLFLGTFGLLSYGGSNLIQEPIFAILAFFFPSLHKKSKEIKSSARKVMDNKISGLNIGFAFSLMVFSTALFFSSICVILVYSFDYSIKEGLIYFFLIVFGLGYMFNYFLIYRKDRYQEFMKTNNVEKKSYFINSIMFHLGTLSIFILSLYITGRIGN